jgi:hypothetical protein
VTDGLSVPAYPARHVALVNSKMTGARPTFGNVIPLRRVLLLILVEADHGDTY